MYYFAGDSILNATPGSFLDAYMFSFQTSSTLGYGYLLPKTTFANILVVFDSLSGLLYVALVTGLIFSKFARPTLKVIFSDKAIITDYDGVPTLMFRVANGRETNIVNASIKVIALKPYTTKEGIEMRRYYPLKLVSDFAPLFTITWTVMHPITKDSPLYGLSTEDILQDEITLILSFTGVDDVMAQSTHANYSYKAQSIVRAKKFADIISVEGDTRTINLDDFNKIIE